MKPGKKIVRTTRFNGKSKITRKAPELAKTKKKGKEAPLVLTCPDSTTTGSGMIMDEIGHMNSVGTTSASSVGWVSSPLAAFPLPMTSASLSV